MKTVISLLCVLYALPAVAANVLAAEHRLQYQITDASKVPLYYVTSIEAFDESHSSSTYLITTAAGVAVRVDVEADYERHRTTAKYEMHGHKPVTVTLDFPFHKATTRSGMLAEVKANPSLRYADVPSTIEGNGHSVHMTEHEWKAARADAQSELRKNVKAAVDPQLAAVLKQLRFIFSAPDLAAPCSTIELLTDGERCMGTTDMLFAVVPPDCDFDAKHGMPCSAEQKARAKGTAPKIAGRWY